MNRLGVPILQIVRVRHTDEATYGVMSFKGEAPFVVTLERPWKDNERNVSCIPPNFYSCAKFSSESHPNTYEVLNVPDRSAILFHPGNTVDDSAGCILVGESFADFGDEHGIGQSRKGFDEMIEKLNGAKTFYLSLNKWEGA